MDERLERISKAANYVAARLGERRPLVGIVLGSGLGDIAELIEEPTVIPYREIPGFPVSTAIGHKGNYIFGKLGGKDVLAMQGRFHYYEGYDRDTLTLSIRVMKMLGIKYLFVSNAAGASNPAFKVGDLVIIKDHISMFPNPLIGPNIEELGPRFPDMTCAYDPELQELAFKIAGRMGITLQTGVYFGSTGPTYETPAEVRFYRTIGADLLGMSTIPEVIVARHMGVKVFGMSVVTNICNTETVAKVLNDGQDVVEQAGLASKKMSTLFTEMIAEMSL